MLNGMPELAEDILGLPVRLGAPGGMGGLVDVVRSPVYATGVGLLLYGVNHEKHNYFKVREPNVYSKVKSRMASWLGEIF